MLIRIKLLKQIAYLQRVNLLQNILISLASSFDGEELLSNKGSK